MLADQVFTPPVKNLGRFLIHVCIAPVCVQGHESIGDAFEDVGDSTFRLLGLQACAQRRDAVRQVIGQFHQEIHFFRFKGIRLGGITVPYASLQNVINKAYSEAAYERENFRKAPHSLKKELEGKGGIKILSYIRDELSKYQTVTDPTEAHVDNVILAMEDQQREFRIRALALVNTINDIAIFVESIEKAIDNITTYIDDRGNYESDSILQRFLSSSRRTY